MIQKWVVREAISQNARWSQYFKEDAALATGRSRTDSNSTLLDGSIDDLAEIILTAESCPDEQMVLEFLEHLASLEDQEGVEAILEKLEAVFNDICSPTIP